MTNQPGLRLEAAEHQLGIAIVLDRFAAEAPGKGALVAVLPDIIGRRDQARLVYPNRELLEPKVRAFVDFIASRVGAKQGKADAGPP